VPEQPVISPVSGYVFEKRLILKFINENGTDPTNNQPLTPEQLIEIKGNFITILSYSHALFLIIIKLRIILIMFEHATFSQSVSEAQAAVGHQHTSAS
jgi:hypothetical protein